MSESDPPPKKNQSLHEGIALAGRSSFHPSEHVEGTQCAFLSSHGCHHTSQVPRAGRGSRGFLEG